MCEWKSSIEGFCSPDELILLKQFIASDVAVAILVFGSFTIDQLEYESDNDIGRNDVISQHYQTISTNRYFTRLCFAYL